MKKLLIGIGIIVGLMPLTAAAYDTTGACPTLERSLTIGSRGDDVMALQTFLQQQGFLSVEPTAYYGDLTNQAVSDYQRANGLDPVGIVGPKTRALLNSGCNVPPQAGKVSVKSQNATLGTPVYGPTNQIVGINMTMSFTIVNSTNNDIYTSSNPAVALVGIGSSQSSKLSNVTLSPSSLAGDTSGAYVVPAGSMRTFTYMGVLYQGSGGVQNFKITRINYGSVPTNTYSNAITANLQTLSLMYTFPPATSGPSVVMSNPTSQFGTAIYNGSTIVGYSIQFTFTLTNLGNVDVYTSRTPATALGFTASSASTTIATVAVSPAEIIYDTSVAYGIPAGTSRNYTYYGVMRASASGGVSTIRITSINYGTSPLNTTSSSITTGLETLSLTGTFSRMAVNPPATSNATLTVTSPNGGETLDKGKTQQVTWTSSGLDSSGQVSVSVCSNATGDANFDGTVNDADKIILSAAWQMRGASPADFNGDGIVDVTDLGIMATNWQKSSCTDLGTFTNSGVAAVNMSTVQTGSAKVRIISGTASDTSNDAFKVVSASSTLSPSRQQGPVNTYEGTYLYSVTDQGAGAAWAINAILNALTH